MIDFPKIFQKLYQADYQWGVTFSKEIARMKYNYEILLLNFLRALQQ
jgi:hypothetical protein